MVTTDCIGYPSSMVLLAKAVLQTVTVAAANGLKVAQHHRAVLQLNNEHKGHKPHIHTQRRFKRPRLEVAELGGL
jgi:hypothetical protein